MNLITHEIRDRIDLICLAISTAIGLYLTTQIAQSIDAMLLIERGKETVGGEVLLYAIILGGSIYFLFQTSQILVHRWYENWNNSDD